MVDLSKLRSDIVKCINHTSLELNFKFATNGDGGDDLSRLGEGIVKCLNLSSLKVVLN